MKLATKHKNWQQGKQLSKIQKYAQHLKNSPLNTFYLISVKATSSVRQLMFKVLIKAAKHGHRLASRLRPRHSMQIRFLRNIGEWLAKQLEPTSWILQVDAWMLVWLKKHANTGSGGESREILNQSDEIDCQIVRVCLVDDWSECSMSFVYSSAARVVCTNAAVAPFGVLLWMCCRLKYGT